MTDTLQIPFKSISFGACFSVIWQYFFAFWKLLYTVECNADYLSTNYGLITCGSFFNCTS